MCVKGDAVKLERLKQQQALVRVQLEKCRAADKEGIFGADRWSQHQIKTLERLDQLVEMLESSEIPVGTAIRLNNDQEFSLLKREVAARQPTIRVSHSEPSLDEIRNLLEGY